MSLQGAETIIQVWPGREVINPLLRKAQCIWTALDSRIGDKDRALFSVCSSFSPPASQDVLYKLDYCMIFLSRLRNQSYTKPAMKNLAANCSSDKSSKPFSSCFLTFFLFRTFPCISASAAPFVPSYASSLKVQIKRGFFR